MYYYGLNWYFYDDFEFIELMHEKRFSEKEFKKMCDEALRYAVKQLLKRKPEKDVFKIGFYHPDFMKLMVKYLEYKYGFKKLKYTAIAEYFGMTIIEEEDWKTGELENFRKIVGEELLKKVLEHNKKVEEILEK